MIRDDFLAVDTPTPGRMSPATAFNFIFVGLALLSLKARRYGIAVWPHWLVVPPLFIATLAMVGYAYGVNSLYQVRIYASMALHTAMAFFVLSLTLLAADEGFGFARVATSDTVGGLASCWLLPTIPIIIFVVGYACLKGQQAGYYELQFGLALTVLFSATICVVAVAWHA